MMVQSNFDLMRPCEAISYLNLSMNALCDVSDEFYESLSSGSKLLFLEMLNRIQGDISDLLIKLSNE